MEKVGDVADTVTAKMSRDMIHQLSMHWGHAVSVQTDSWRMAGVRVEGGVMLASSITAPDSYFVPDCLKLHTGPCLETKQWTALHCTALALHCTALCVDCCLNQEWYLLDNRWS